MWITDSDCKPVTCKTVVQSDYNDIQDVRSSTPIPCTLNYYVNYFILSSLKGALSYAKVNRLMCVCLMVSWLVEPPTMTSKLFTRHSPSKRESLQPYEWSVLACSRLSETGKFAIKF